MVPITIASNENNVLCTYQILLLPVRDFEEKQSTVSAADNERAVNFIMTVSKTIIGCIIHFLPFL